MDDLISRQAAIDAVDDALKGVFVEHQDIAEKIIDKLPSEQPEPKWIPVEDELPEKGKRVLVTIPLVNGYPWVRTAWYGTPMFENKICFYESDSEWGDCEISGVTAWMPLPQPYERSEDE